MRSTNRTRSLRLASGLFLLPLAATLIAQTPQWKSFGSSADGFHASFPTQPEVSKDSVPVGPETYELRSYVSEAGSTVLYIAVCDYGPNGAAADPQALLSSAKSGAVSHINAHILTEKKIILDSYPGVEFEAESDKLRITARMYIAGGVLFQTMVTTPSTEKYAETGRFLDSFHIVPRPHTEAAAAPAPADWKPYPFPADGFSASFPSQPTMAKQNVDAGGGTLEIRTYTADDSSASLIVAVCDYGSAAAGKDPDDLLDGAKQGAVSNIKGHLVSEKKISLGVNHGVAFEADTDSAHVSARIYMVGTTLYQMIVASPLKSSYASTDRFLESFQLIARSGK